MFQARSLMLESLPGLWAVFLAGISWLHALKSLLRDGWPGLQHHVLLMILNWSAARHSFQRAAEENLDEKCVDAGSE